MIKKLIINADDFGMCEGNSLGILLAHEQGIVSSTTVMMNMPYASWALDKAKAYPCQLSGGQKQRVSKFRNWCSFNFNCR